jgi:hypothetical protein
VLPTRKLELLLVALLSCAACFDPLYEDGDPLTSAHVVCCVGGRVTTCFCPEASSCAAPVFPCAGGRCAPTPNCPSAAGGGAGGGGGSLDAGTSSWDAGSSSGDAGLPPPDAFEFCCVEAKVTTCQCPSSGCVASAFTACPGGACVAASQALCR